MKLKSIKVDMFKGIESSTLSPQGEDLSIIGLNMTGKTSHFDAFMWGLFGKDSFNNKDFEIKPTETVNPEPTVEIVLTNNGIDFKLNRSYKEVWRKPRGEARPVFDGHTTVYTVDDEKVGAKRFGEIVGEIIDINLFRLLSDPRYFNEVMHWQKRRDLITAMFNITSDFDLEGAQRIKKITTERNTEISKRLEFLKGKLDDAETKGNTLLKPDVNIPELRIQLRKLQEERATIISGGEASKLEVSIGEIDNEIERIKIQHENKIANGGPNKAEIQKLDDELSGHIKAKALADVAVVAAQDTLERYTRDHKSKQDEYMVLYKDSFEATRECPTCNQAIPESTIKQAEENFKKKQSEGLSKIKAEGVVLAKAKADAEAKLVTAKAELETEVDAVASLTERINKLRSAGPDQNAPSLTELAEYKDAMERKSKLVDQRQEAISNTQSVIEAKDLEIDALSTKIQSSEIVQATWDAHQKDLEGLSQFKNEETDILAEFEENKKTIAAQTKAIRNYLRAISEPVNSAFEHISFKLFNELVNGDIEECCEAMSKTGVPYGSMSNSQKIRAGLEMIRFAAKHFGTDCPVWIDNAESCDHLIDMGDIQLIQLIVPFIPEGEEYTEAMKQYYSTVQTEPYKED